LLVERRKPDVVPALIQLVNDHTADREGLNPGALHALWTLHGLGAVPGNPEALAAARNALYHPAASLRRAALMLLPRDQQLLDAIFTAGILPDRSSPWPVEYTVPTSILQDADAHVRLEALLVLSELPPSPRAAAALAEIISLPSNARDAWIPDAVSIGGSKQGSGFLVDLIKRRVPANDSLAVAGMQKAVAKLGRYHAAQTDLGTVVNLISVVSQATPALAIGMLNGMAEGWPQDAPPLLSAEQKVVLVAAARDASPELTAAFDKVAARWAMPDVFKP
jgi:hypothetical protein